MQQSTSSASVSTLKKPNAHLKIGDFSMKFFAAYQTSIKAAAMILHHSLHTASGFLETQPIVVMRTLNNFGANRFPFLKNFKFNAP